MSKNTTSYIVFADGEATTITRSKKATAIAAAQGLLSSKEATTVEVQTATGSSVFTAARRKTGKRTPAGTRVVTLSPEHQALVPAGYVAAYARLRNTAVVLRNEDAPEPERYAVIDTVQGEFVGFAETTRGAGAIMKQLGEAVRAKRALLAPV